MDKKTGFEIEDHLFDIEQYNYLINKKGALDDFTLINNYHKLNYVLNKLNETDNVLLDLLQYSSTTSNEEIHEYLCTSTTYKSQQRLHK